MALRTVAMLENIGNIFSQNCQLNIQAPKDQYFFLCRNNVLQVDQCSPKFYNGLGNILEEGVTQTLE